MLWVAKKLKHRREGRKKLNFFLGGAGTLFAKFWLVCHHVRLGNVCGCEALAYCLFFNLILCQIFLLQFDVCVICMIAPITRIMALIRYPMVTFLFITFFPYFQIDKKLSFFVFITNLLSPGIKVALLNRRE